MNQESIIKGLKIRYSQIDLKKLHLEQKKNVDKKDEVFENNVEIEQFDEKENSAVIKNYSRILINNIIDLDMEVSANIKATGYTNEQGGKLIDLLEQTKIKIARPLLAQSSLIISFITDKMHDHPLIVPPDTWDDSEDEGNK